MTAKEMEKRLKNYSNSCQKIMPNQKEETIAMILKSHMIQRTRGNVWSFFCEQIGYLFRCCFLWQMLWAGVFYGFIKYSAYGNGELLVLLSALPAILTLITVEEITKVYQKSMLEIEYATKYSLQSAVIVRMFVLCVIHSILLTVGIISVRAQFDSGLTKLLVYGFTPMILMTGILIKAMKYFKGEKLRLASIGIYAGMIIFCFVGNMEQFGIYRWDYFKLWEIACVAGSAFFVYQMFRLRSELGNFEQLIQYD